MLFAVRFYDRTDRTEVRRQQLQAHIDWLDEHKDVVLIGGSLRKEPGENPVGGLWLVEAPDRNVVEVLIQSDPFSIHGLRRRHEIFLWSKAFPERTALV
jgi:uncharacterized protein